MKLTIIGVLLVIAYIFCSNLLRIRNLRRQERTRQALRDAAWHALVAETYRLHQQKKAFLALTSQISPEDRRNLWLSVDQLMERATNYVLASDYACASAQMIIAGQRAELIIEKHKAS
jgi:hypothetical protein